MKSVLSVVCLFAFSASLFAKAPATEKWVVFYTSKVKEYVGYGENFNSDDVRVTERRKIVDVKILKDTSALEIRTRNADGEEEVHNFSASNVEHRDIIEKILTSEASGDLWLPTPGAISEALGAAWLETYAHLKSPKNKVAHYLESMVAKKAEDAHRDRQVEKGEYGIHQIQKLVDWASGIGTFKSTH